MAIRGVPRGRFGSGCYQKSGLDWLVGSVLIHSAGSDHVLYKEKPSCTSTEVFYRRGIDHHHDHYPDKIFKQVIIHHIPDRICECVVLLNLNITLSSA